MITRCSLICKSSHKGFGHNNLFVLLTSSGLVTLQTKAVESAPSARAPSRVHATFLGPKLFDTLDTLKTQFPTEFHHFTDKFCPKKKTKKLEVPQLLWHHLGSAHFDASALLRLRPTSKQTQGPPRTSYSCIRSK